MSETKRKRAKPQYREGFGIVNPWGQFWGTNIFSSEDAAREFFAAFWRNNPNAPSWDTYRVVPARLRISEISPTQETTR